MPSETNDCTRCRALRADRARHAHLRLPLGGEHHEDHEDEHDAGGDREHAQHQEERREEVAVRLALLDRVGLDAFSNHRLPGFETSSRKRCRARAVEVAGEGRLRGRSLVDCVVDAADQRDADPVDPARLPEQRVQRACRDRDPASHVGVAIAQHARGELVLDDARHLERVRRTSHVKHEDVAGFEVQVLGGALACVELTLVESEIRGAAIGEPKPSEAAQPLGVEAGELHGRDRVACPAVHGGGCFEPHGEEAGDVLSPANAVSSTGMTDESTATCSPSIAMPWSPLSSRGPFRLMSISVRCNVS